MLTFGSAFSGFGGLDLGLERAGWVCRWQIENNPYADRVLARHWPQVRRYGDIRELSGDELERVDLVAGGPPCQPVSHAGEKLGADDERWLWEHFFRVLGRVRPRFALMENPTALIDRGFDIVLGGLAQLGFDAEWSVLSACAVGAPHPRERVFLLAYAAGEGREGRGVVAPGQEILDGTRYGAAPRRPWPVQPRPSGVAYGVPDRVERLRGIGNAVVPQVAEWIGRMILEAA